MSTDPSTLKVWRHHLADEADAAFLYDALADVEAEAPKNEVYRRLAEVERRHVELWCEVFERHGLEVTAPQPSLRARLSSSACGRAESAGISFAAWPGRARRICRQNA